MKTIRIDNTKIKQQKIMRYTFDNLVKTHRPYPNLSNQLFQLPNKGVNFVIQLKTGTYNETFRIKDISFMKRSEAFINVELLDKNS